MVNFLTAVIMVYSGICLLVGYKQVTSTILQRLRAHFFPPPPPREKRKKKGLTNPSKSDRVIPVEFGPDVTTEERQALLDAITIELAKGN